MTDLYAPIIEKIEAAKAKLAELNIDRTIADLVWDARPDIEVDGVEAWAKYYEVNRDGLAAHTAYGEIERYEETLRTPLVKPTKRYLITEGKLLSPAGYAPNSGVYVRNKNWLETDRRPRRAPLLWHDAVFYDLDKVIEENTPKVA